MPLPSDEAVARKAFELWEARGRPHGGDQDDWHLAKEMLTRSPPGVDPAQSVVKALTDNVFGAASVAIDVATHMVEEIFGATRLKAAEPATSASSPVPKPAPDIPSDDALVKAERTLQLETDKRVRDAALKAGAPSRPDQP